MCRKLIYFVSFILVLGLVLTNVARSDDPGWPVNCVKLSPGQTITLDGVVTPQEYDGAQAFIINDQTVNAPFSLALQSYLELKNTIEYEFERKEKPVMRTL